MRIDFPFEIVTPIIGQPKMEIRSLQTLRSLASLFISLTALTTYAAPRHVYLTWQGDTSQTITVNYQTLEPTESSTVHFDTKPGEGRPESYRHTATGSAHQIPGLADGRKIHWVELRKLTPGQTYYFIAGDPQKGFTAERKFRTIPSGTENLRFVIGGDMGTGSDLPVLLQQAAKMVPDFGVVGGDIAYANDMRTNFSRWDVWLDNWETNMVTPNGYTIPMVLAIGNHEVRGGTASSPANAQLLSRYDAAVVRDVRKCPQKLGCVREDKLLAGDLVYQDFKSLPREDDALALRTLLKALVSRVRCPRPPCDGSARQTLPPPSPLPDGAEAVSAVAGPLALPHSAFRDSAWTQGPSLTR